MQLRRLEAAREIANQLAQGGNRVMLDSAGLLLNGACELISFIQPLFISTSSLFLFLLFFLPHCLLPEILILVLVADDAKDLLNVKKK